MNKFIALFKKTSPVYLIGVLRYSHKVCDNNMYLYINQSFHLNIFEYTMSINIYS